jgi:hypothetical protein
MATLSIRNLPNKAERAEIGKAARSIYESLQKTLEKDHWGEYIAINVKSGDYAISTSHEDAAKRMYAKYPGEIPFIIRIGYRAVYHFGGSGLNDGKRS